uniref:Fibulin-1 n=1 Tax=Steinernema glaseri TaxID=37863 RepID=A0A1I7YGE9_9BILA
MLRGRTPPLPRDPEVHGHPRRRLLDDLCPHGLHLLSPRPAGPQLRQRDASCPARGLLPRLDEPQRRRTQKENSVLAREVEGDRCAAAKCEHTCNDRGDFEVECSCREGYELGPDGASCIDIDECVLQLSDCRLDSQRCLNTPGSFKCIRTLSCGTGYALDGRTEQCIDVDECNLGTHDCGTLYQCRNTQGSFRCDPKKCATTELMNPRTGECVPVDCPPGYEAKEGQCLDIDECQLPDVCGNFEECINAPGSFRCQEIGDLCNRGFALDKATGFCADVNECLDGTHLCGEHLCINLVGSFKCRCSAGFEFNATTLRCEDVDECTKFPGHMCLAHSTCVNTIGSFECTCEPGFALGADGRTCEDIDECAADSSLCAQECVNTPGSFRCACRAGFSLAADGVACEDIDECRAGARRGVELCMGGCTNTVGSFRCECPSGFEVDVDGVTCRDLDECALGECPQPDQICVNTIGAFKCHRVRCPRHYTHDPVLKNRCNRGPGACKRLSETQCRKHPVHVSWQYIAIPRHVNISSQRTSVVLFSMKGPAAPEYHMQFELQLINARPENPSVLPAIRSNFLLQKGAERNSAVIALRDSLDGPQVVELELALRLSVGGEFRSKFVANLIVHVSQHRPQPVVEHRRRRHHDFFF